ncbi:sensor histidine kinase [Paenibacillus sp. SC116]|uniref:cache domain-containing sensor histidine kinase n=1 Tax=Paenibacillus sp. SC116 TaxID=2968986 RepID=UPI00215A22AF|nr:sensor histidine kinase [Paenibacillus sp. SC116]MCR8843238.1 sensor histidine kinase [Paenibacillus sp. SC116]
MQWIVRSLHRKMSFVLIFATMVPIVLLGFVSYHTASKITEEKVTMSNLNTLRQINAYMETIVQDVENMSVFLIGQEQVQSYLSKTKANATEYLDMTGFLTNLAFSKRYISEIRIISLQGMPEVSNNTILESSLFQVADMSVSYWEEHSKWWSPPLESTTSAGKKRSVFLVRPIRDHNTFKTLGMLSIGIDTAVLSEQLRVAVQEHGVMFLQNEKGQIIASSTTDLDHDLLAMIREQPKLQSYSEQMWELDSSSGRHIVIAADVPLISSWQAFTVIPYDTVSSQNRYVLLLTAVAVGLAFLITAFAVMFFVKQVTKPLIRLTRYLATINPDSVYRRLPIETPDEIGQLIKTYNRLSENIGQLTEQVKINEAMKKEADLKALQAQIQPHFLYNTLSSIQWMAWMNKQDQIAEMVGSLSDFLRFSLNRGLEVCSVKQEIEHVRNYMNIQAIRYPERFDMEVSVQPTLLDKPILKLLLQPLVENALIHGILKDSMKQRGQVTIDIRECEEEGWMECQVCDNGVGISEERLQSLQMHMLSIADGKRGSFIPSDPLLESDRAAHGSGYGLMNVQQRLLLHYGATSQVSISSQMEHGTCIILRFKGEW